METDNNESRKIRK